MKQLLSKIIPAMSPRSVRAEKKSAAYVDTVEIQGLAYDSRTVKKDFLFFALEGLHADGHTFIDAAIDAGAVAIAHQRELAKYREGIVYILVQDSRASMSPAAAAFYGNPSSQLCLIGVTGTEGKSTTVSFIWQLLNLAGHKAGFFSTVMSDTGLGEKPNPEHQTTPEATSVQKMLAAMRDATLEYAVVEASSHGLSPRTSRLADVAFDVAVMTNVRHEHLEFHGTWEQYRHDKANLFRALATCSHTKTIAGRRVDLQPGGVINLKDPSAAYFCDATAAALWGYDGNSAHSDVGLATSADAVEKPAATKLKNLRSLRADNIVQTEKGIDFVIRGPANNPCAANTQTGQTELAAHLNLPGLFNIDNALAAIAAAAQASGEHWSHFAALLPQLVPVRGRMTSLHCGQSFDIIIDYAHTPSSFQTVLPDLRARTKGKLICLFGSGGERDREKRPAQGRIAAQYADIVILSDEDPRGEDPMELLEEIAAGCAGLQRGDRLFLIPDRPAAIRKAFSLASSGDLVALLGKGHENSIIYKDRTMPYDEEREALSALAEAACSKNCAVADTEKE